MNVLIHSSKRTLMVTAVATALGVALPLQNASADLTFQWSGWFTMLDADGNAFANSSLNIRSEQGRTPIVGTMVIADDFSAGTLTVEPFDFFGNNGLGAAGAATARTITLQNIGNGVCTNNDPDQGCGAGNLILANMLFDWGGNTNIPVSAVMDASGLIDAAADPGFDVGSVISNTGVLPAAEGTYGTKGFMVYGLHPVATTTWNTTNAPGCSPGDCTGVSPSGVLPLVVDNTLNVNLSYGGPDVFGIGGNPMQDGPFPNNSANFDITSMTLVSDGSVSFVVPDDILRDDIPEAPFPTTIQVDLLSPSDVVPGGATVEYCLDTVAVCDADTLWQADDGTNQINVDIEQYSTVTVVNWRVSDGGGGLAFDTQSVTAIVDDNTAPVFTTPPADVVASVETTAETVVFATAGSVIATDGIELDRIEWSLNVPNWNLYDPSVNTSSSSFGPGTNTVYWRAIDAAGNVSAVYEQSVTLDLPTGIIGQPCTIDPDLLEASIGSRLLEGVFTMRDSNGRLVGAVDTHVTGEIDTSRVCTDTSCTLSGAALESPTPFFAELWSTSTIRLFNQPGTYTFDVDCTAAQIVAGVTSCNVTDRDSLGNLRPEGRELTLNLQSGQLGAHMLFDWSVNRNIDVVLVWDYSCGSAELVSTDPDGDGIIGTTMVDGPFTGFNAAFDLRTVAGQPPITTGGFKASIPTVKNPVENTSPIALEPGEIGTMLGGVTITASELFDSYGAAADGSVLESCVGGCFDFEVDGLATGATIQVVLPLSEPIPWYSLYRKYDAASDNWRTFAVAGTDNVMTAPMDESGFCPEPGAGDYSANASGIMANMLRPGDQCVQLTITDGGPNDTNPADGVIGDPGGVAVTSSPAAPEAPTTGGGGCTLAAGDVAHGQRIDLWLLAGLMGLLGLRRKHAS